ncbi:NifB/NifX family molybdenum-iron cluster-binding protein [Methanoregula sp. PtaU1.Bin006]|uniref:NifB/NifX family molybdenum-iron cluster-binding protein n=1 Tax=Methanoregula sp. PtaU1.Bin006 TaxID=1811681 RepID=UPI0025CCE4DD|nr:NifB/NifX family molybdenum-iron cluster-binding protein [Methanoregula sp. PtaU1.Bin006]
MMKICITARGKTLDSAFERHFARTPFFIFYDTETRKSEAILNGFVISDTRIGQNAVRLLKNNGLDAVITGEIGENARALLTGANIALHLFSDTGTIRQVISEYLKSQEQNALSGTARPT